MQPPYDTQAPKKAANLSINADLLAKARELDINLSATLEQALTETLKHRLRDQWLTENKLAMEAYNDHVEKHGVFSDGARTFLMPQFTVYRNPNPDTKATYPLLVDVQSDLIADLATRMVIPLSPASAMKGKLIKTLTPLFEIDGKQYAMLTPQMAGISRKQLGAKVGDLSAHRDEIIAGLDLLIAGI